MGLPHPDPRSICALSSTEFVDPLPRKKFLGTPLVVIGLLTGYNTLRRHLYVMVLSDNLTCRKCGTEGGTSVHILCECEALAQTCTSVFLLFGP
jgi:hypothetical protein